MAKKKRTYCDAVAEARRVLNVSLSEIRTMMEDQGHPISKSRLGEFEYGPVRQLNVTGKRRLEQISEALRALAIGKELDAEQFQPWVLWPDMFGAPALATSK